MLDQKVTEAFIKHRSVSTDSRKVRPGDIFFALPGDNFDGNRYAALALEAGAAFAVVSDAGVVPIGDSRYIVVANVLRCLQDLANWYRRTFQVPFLGITGTNGKTTTKELVHAVMSADRRVHATSGNFNNHIGVPLTLLAMPTDIDFAIIEMGANKPGDIKELVEIAEPTHGLITNIGMAHLEGFGSLEGVRRTKGEMYDFVRAHGGTAFVNLHDFRVAEMGTTVASHITYGEQGGDYSIQSLTNHDDHMDLVIHFKRTSQNHSFQANLIGLHNAENVLTAVAIGDTFGVPVELIRKGLAGYFPKLNRTELIQGPGFKVLLDAYNANPSSMEAALRAIQGQWKGSSILILGDMFELGTESPQHHLALVRLAKELMPEALLIGVGKEMRTACKETGHGLGFADVESLEKEISDLLEKAEFVMIKGSRGMALERLLPAMKVQRTPSAH